MTDQDETKTEPAEQPKVRPLPFQSSLGIGKLTAALAQAQGQIEGAKKESDNPFFHSKYADLASVWEACRKPLADNQLAVIQLPGQNGNGLCVDTILSHSSGEWICSRLLVRPGYTNREGKFVALEDPQAIGSAITYARRYALQSIVGIAPEDDDGNAASGSGAIDRRQQHREESAAQAGLPQLPAFEGDWRQAVVPNGKDKGKTLGQLPSGKVTWYRKNWQPRPHRGTFDPAELMFRAALNSLETGSGPAGAAGASKPDDDDQLPME